MFSMFSLINFYSYSMDNSRLNAAVLELTQSIEQLFSLNLDDYIIPSADGVIASDSVIRCKRKLNQILEEINFSDNNGICTRMIKRILDDVRQNNDLEHFFYDQVILLEDKLSKYHNDAKKNKSFKNFISDNLERIIGILTFKYLPSEADKKVNLKYWSDCCDLLMSAFVNGIDLVDRWLFYAKENNLSNFKKELFGEQKNDLTHLDAGICCCILEADRQKDLIDLLEKNYNYIVESNLLNKNYSEFMPLTILEYFFDHSILKLSILRKNAPLLHKIINEPSLSANVLVKVAARLLERKQFYPSDEIPEILHDYANAITNALNEKKLIL